MIHKTAAYLGTEFSLRGNDSRISFYRHLHADRTDMRALGDHPAGKNGNAEDFQGEEAHCRGRMVKKTYTTDVLVVGGCEKFSAEQKTNQMVKAALGSTSCSLPRSLLIWYPIVLFSPPPEWFCAVHGTGH